MYTAGYTDYSDSEFSGHPPLYAIGKSSTVDEDEPPEVLLDAYGLRGEGTWATSSEDSVFDAYDAADACKLLHKGFHTSRYGSHTWRRRPDHGGGYFVHCRHAAALGSYYTHLQRLLKERALKELLRDCVYRLYTVQMFTVELECLLKAEDRTAYAIRHGCMQRSPVSKLFCLNALCEDLRTHVGHWNSIKQRINSCRWLKSVRGVLYRDLLAVHRTFAFCCDRAIFTIHRLIQVGFEVLGHIDVVSLTSDILWNITRGLEDFNNIVSTHQLNTRVNDMQSLTTPICCSPLSEGIRSISFNKVLTILANERSRYAAMLIYHYFTSSETFHATLTCNSQNPTFQWQDDVGSAVSSICLQSCAANRDNSPDYQMLHHGNGNVHGSVTSLSSAVSLRSILRIPDFSSRTFPLAEFLEKEHQFADRLLQSVCSSTSLLRQNDAVPNSRVKSKHRSDFKGPTMSPFEGRPVKTQIETSFPKRPDSHRKTVSWGDNVDVSIRSQAVARYMKTLWHQFGCNLDLFLDEPAWRSRMGLLRSSVGTILMYSDSTIAVLRHLMEHFCMKDALPSGSVSPLLGVALRLHALSAFAAWDSSLCGGNSSQASDKYYPCLTGKEQYSTRSAQLLHASHQPLISLLQEVCRRLGLSGYSHHDSMEPFSQHDLDLCLVSSISYRLLSSCHLSHMWCTNKLHSTLFSWNIKVFLFLFSTDLQILKDCGQQLCHLHESLSHCSRSQHGLCLLDELCAEQIVEYGQQATCLVSQLQALEHSSLKEFTEKFSQQSAAFFKEQLPLSKLWRRRVLPDFPEDPNSYVQYLWDSLLSPITQAISRLPVSSQLDVLMSAVITVCRAWTSAFLRDKTKFSLYGAHQLGVDFDHFRTQLNNDTLMEEVRTEVLDLPIFHQLNGIVQLLKQQPAKRSTSRFRYCSTEDLACDSRDPSPSASRSELPVNIEESHDGNDVCMVPNPEEWLALRVIGGSRSWRLPACFRRGTKRR